MQTTGVTKVWPIVGEGGLKYKFVWHTYIIKVYIKQVPQTLLHLDQDMSQTRTVASIAATVGSCLSVCLYLFVNTTTISASARSKRHSLNNAQFLKKGAWLLHLIGDKAPPAARDRSEVVRT